MASLPEGTRSDLLAYLRATSSERTAIVAVLYAHRPELADLLGALQADADLRARFETALIHQPSQGWSVVGSRQTTWPLSLGWQQL